MKILKPVFPFITLLFWFIIICVIVVFANRDSIFTYSLAFIPVHFIAIIIRYFTSRILISDNIISTKIYFDKFEIDLNKVKSFEVKKRNVLYQILSGVSKEVTIVEYNKYDTLQLNSADPVLLEALSSNGKVS